MTTPLGEPSDMQARLQAALDDADDDDLDVDDEDDDVEVDDADDGNVRVIREPACCCFTDGTLNRVLLDAGIRLDTPWASWQDGDGPGPIHPTIEGVTEEMYTGLFPQYAAVLCRGVTRNREESEYDRVYCLALARNPSILAKRIREAMADGFICLVALDLDTEAPMWVGISPGAHNQPIVTVVPRQEDSVLEREMDLCSYHDLDELDEDVALAEGAVTEAQIWHDILVKTVLMLRDSEPLLKYRVDQVQSELWGAELELERAVEYRDGLIEVRAQVQKAADEYVEPVYGPLKVM